VLTAPTSIITNLADPVVTVMWGVTNHGPAVASGGWFDAVWFSTNGLFDANSVMLNYFWEDQSIPMNGSYWQTNSVTLPLVASGNYTLFVQVDAFDDLYEASLADKVSAGVSGAYTLVPPLAIGGFNLMGANLVLSGNFGLAGTAYTVLMGTNLAVPVNQWTPVATNVLSTNGSFSITAINAVQRGAPQRYYILQAP
jgi:hypothetical protein